eukprot:PhM_4_TR8384/c2_g1_i2/m.11994
MNGSTAKLEEYRHRLRSVVELFIGNFTPNTRRVVLRTSPAPSKEFRHEHVLTAMMNRVVCEVAHEFSSRGVSCLNLYSLTLPFAEVPRMTDGHHWLQNAKANGKVRAYRNAMFGTPFVLLYQSALVAAMCDD